MIRNNTHFKMKKYKHGWKIWFKADNQSILLGGGLKKNEAEDIIKGIINEPKITYEVKEYS